MDDLHDLEAAEPGRPLNEKRLDRPKRSIARHQPLKHKLNGSIVLKINSRATKRRSCLVRRESLTATNEERLKQVEEQIESTLRLPTASSYAQHRLRILHKAKEMLTARSTLDQEGHLELERLLAQLSIRYQPSGGSNPTEES